MIKISKRTQYGLRAMVLLAKCHKNKQVCSVKTISQKEGISFDFLEKIISQFSTAKLVKSKKGIQGGYILSRHPSKITAKDIVSALKEDKELVECGCCKRAGKCSAKSVWKKMDKGMNKTLKSITLKDLI